MATNTKVFVVIERITTLLVLSAASLILFQAAGKMFTSSDQPIELSTYKAGDQFPALPGLDNSTASPALVLYLRSNCSYCTASMDFYRRLTKTTPRSHRIVVVGTESKETLELYISSHGVVVDQVLSVPRGTLKIAGTPTLLSVESSGRISRVWRGKLGTAEEESEVASILAADTQRR